MYLIEIHVYPPPPPLILNPNIIFYSFMLSVPTFKVFIKIVMFDMKQFVIYTAFKKQMLGDLLEYSILYKDDIFHWIGSIIYNWYVRPITNLTCTTVIDARRIFLI